MKKRNSRPLPLSLRLAATSGLLVAATLIFVAALSARLTHTYLTREIDYRLRQTVTDFQDGPAQRVRRPEDLAQEARGWLAVHAFDPDEVAAVRTSDGTVLTSAGGLDLRQVPGVRDLLTSATLQWRILQGPQARIRAVAVPLMLGDQQTGTLLVAAAKTRLNATIQALTWRIALASALGFLMAVILGHTAVRRSLRPLGRMLTEVEAIQATGDMSRTVAHQGPDDEVGRLAVAFDRMLDRLREAFRSQQRFIADASHELRTPLAVARGHLELLQQELTRTVPRRSLGIAMEELDRMGRIVDDLLLLARLDEGMTLSKQPVDVELVAREALLRGMLLAPRATRVDTEAGVCALADPDRLLQVVTNLLTNAAQHGGENARITLTARREGERVVITVADTGPGISADELPHIFERFYRGSRARTGPGGTGLGLAIVASLVTAMDGEITAQSRPGTGTTFAVTLPIASGLPAPEPAAAPPVSAGPE